jgi:DNA-directed RNA polymerase specialized sigma24 family protein
MRALGRSLLGGDGRRPVQDGWVAALQAPHTASARDGSPARCGGSLLRGGRSDWRRQQHERQAARPEACLRRRDCCSSRGSSPARRRRLEQLHEPYRTAVVLRFGMAFAPAQLGARLGRAPNTARSRVQRGIELLRSELTRELRQPRRLGGPAGGMRRSRMEQAGLVRCGIPAHADLRHETKLLLGTSCAGAPCTRRLDVACGPAGAGAFARGPRQPGTVAATAAAATASVHHGTGHEHRTQGSTGSRAHRGAGGSMWSTNTSSRWPTCQSLPSIADSKREARRRTPTAWRCCSYLQVSSGFKPTLCPKSAGQTCMREGPRSMQRGSRPTALVMERYSCAVRVLVVDDLSAPLEGVRIRRMTNTADSRLHPSPPTRTVAPCSRVCHRLARVRHRAGFPEAPASCCLANSRQRCTVARDGLTSIEYHLARMAKVLFAVNGCQGVDVEFWPRMRTRIPGLSRASCRTRNGVLTLSLPPGTRDRFTDRGRGQIRRLPAHGNVRLRARENRSWSRSRSSQLRHRLVDRVGQHGLPVETASVCAKEARSPEPMWTKCRYRSTAQGGHYVWRGIPEGPLDLFIDRSR